MADRTLPDNEARAYLTGKFDQLTAAIVAQEWDRAVGVINQIRTDGFPTVADHALDGLIAAKNDAPSKTDTCRLRREGK